MACPPLPLDLVYMIIDSLHDHRPALEVCSRVCKAWTWPAQRLLFMRLILDRHNMRRLSNLGVNSHRRAILAHVRHIILLGARGLVDGPLWAEAMPLLVGVENTRRLTIAYFHVCHSIQSGLFDQLANTVILTILNIRCNSFSDLVQLICAFPRLEEMTLSLTAPFWSNPHQPPIAYRLPRSLRSLSLVLSARHEEPISMLEWFASQQPLPLQTFGLDYSAPAQRAIPHINEFLQHLGPILETAEFTSNGCTFFPPSLRQSPY